jgi:hypothetical protein
VSEAALHVGSSSAAAVALERALASPAIAESDRRQAETLRAQLGLAERSIELSASGER